MNECEIAQKFIVDRNNHLTTMHKETGIALRTLKSYRANPEKLETAAWNKVHNLAKLAKSSER